MSRIIDDKDYILSRVIIQQDGCWLWTGSTNGKYGTLGRRSKRWYAHIFSFITHCGPTRGLNVCHTCDVPLCCNPKHLFLGTQQENIMDAFNKGRMVTPPQKYKEEHQNSKLTQSQVDEIRYRVSQGETKASVARSFDISATWVCRLSRNEVWKT